MYIGISAKKRRGKDTVASMLEQHGYKKFAFADKPCELLLHGVKTARQRYPECPDITWDDLRGRGVDRESDIGITPNYGYAILIAAWEEYLRERNIFDAIANFDVFIRIHQICHKRLVNDEHWTIRALMQTFGTDIGCWYDKNIWVQYAREFAEINKNVVFLDCRQSWEYEFVVELGGTIFHIHRDVAVEEDTHSTERGLPVGPDDFVINNNGTLDELQAQVDMIVNSFKGE